MNTDNNNTMIASSATKTSTTTTSNNDTSNTGIFEVARTRWLTVEEIISLLSGAYESEEHESIYGFPHPNAILRCSTSPPHSPPSSGTIFLYDRVAVRNYKVDGYDWIRKRSNPAKIREDHVKLRYKGTHRVGGNYVHSADIDTLHRRVYRLLETDQEKAAASACTAKKKALVLVHYLDTTEAAKVTMMKNSDGSVSHASRSNGKRIRESDHSDAIGRYYETKRTHTANSHAEAMNAPSRYHYDGSDYYGHRKASACYNQPHVSGYSEGQQAVVWSPAVMMASATCTCTCTAGRSASSDEAAHLDLDRVNFDQLWGSIESDAALAHGLDQLLEADAAVKGSSNTNPEEAGVPLHQKAKNESHYMYEI